MRGYIKKGTGICLAVLLLLLQMFCTEPVEVQARSMVIVLDPGHGGSDGGTTGFGLLEKNLNLRIALYAKATLENSGGATVYLTRDRDVAVDLEDRPAYGRDKGADLFVSLHNNAAGGRGSEVYVPWQFQHGQLAALGNQVLKNLSALGLANRGVKTRTYDRDDVIYDYYCVIRESVSYNIPSILIEHAFVDSPTDKAFLDNEPALERLGQADGRAIVDYYGLYRVQKSSEVEKLTSPNDSDTGVVYQTHVQNDGWIPWNGNGAVNGTEGKSYRMEALNIQLTNAPSGARIIARAHVQDLGWVGSEAVDGYIRVGTTGQSRRIEGIQLTLEGMTGYALKYRVHIQNYGWLDWVYQGETAGSVGQSLRLEAIQVMVVKDKAEKTTYHPAIAAKVHVQDYGWLPCAQDGEMAGTEGQSKRMEGLYLQVVNAPPGAYLSGRVHIQDHGWRTYSNINASVLVGTQGESRRLEAIELQLNNAPGYKLQYRVHIQDIGWSNWTDQGKMAGTEGRSKRLEAIEFRVVS